MKFKVGNKVKILDLKPYTGDTGVVCEADSSKYRSFPYRVKFENGSNCLFYEKELQLYDNQLMLFEL